MKKALIFTGIVAMIVIAGCTKSPKIVYAGITEMDKFGAVVGKADSTDWRTDDVWTEKEIKLFPTASTANCPQPAKLKIMFYANPCRGKSVLFLMKDSTTNLSLRIVDRDYNILMKADGIKDNASTLDLTPLNTNDTVRMYYKFIDAKNCEFKGHGDIVLKFK